MKRTLLLAAEVLMITIASAQKQVSITIDDIPNIRLEASDGYRSRLLEKIDSMHLPVALFINENHIFEGDSLSKNLMLFNKWIISANTTLGNHAFTHAMYSAVGIDSFRTEIIKGETITRELARKQHKPEIYFRFPYNDLGVDEKQHQEIARFLTDKHYVITPFTVHSEDWLVTQLYEYYKSHHLDAEAAKVGEDFIRKTMEYFDYIDAITSKKLRREVKQIYLMHDNLLNADYLDKLVKALHDKGYSFITLDDAMTDPIYAQKDYFQEKDGISWVYRWIADPKERSMLINKGPNTRDFQEALDKVKKQ